MMDMNNGFYELDETEMYAIDGGAVDPVSALKLTIKVAKYLGVTGAIVVAGAFVIGAVYEGIVGE